MAKSIERLKKIKQKVIQKLIDEEWLFSTLKGEYDVG